jgi:hypothetical protein
MSDVGEVHFVVTQLAEGRSQVKRLRVMLRGCVLRQDVVRSVAFAEGSGQPASQRPVTPDARWRAFGLRWRDQLFMDQYWSL